MILRFFMGVIKRMELLLSEVRKVVVVEGGWKNVFFKGKEQVFIFGSYEFEQFVRYLSGGFKQVSGQIIWNL